MRSRVQDRESCVDWETFWGDGTGRVVGSEEREWGEMGTWGRLGGRKREWRGGILMRKGVGRKRGGFVGPNQVV